MPENGCLSHQEKQADDNEWLSQQVSAIVALTVTAKPTEAGRWSLLAAAAARQIWQGQQPALPLNIWIGILFFKKVLEISYMITKRILEKFKVCSSFKDDFINNDIIILIGKYKTIGICYSCIFEKKPL